jgi:predicted metal-dependent hydrolase
MNTRNSKIQVSNLMIDTVKKDIRNLHLGVYPPKGRVRVAAPLETTDEAIKLFVLSRMHWIKTQQQKFQDQERQTIRQYLSGESHYFLGDRHLLDVVQTDGRPRIDVPSRKKIVMHIIPNATHIQKEALFERFYRFELKKLAPTSVEKWQTALGVQAREVRIRKMKTKWGTCNTLEGRIWLNLELAKKDADCIDYVIVHELAHLKEKNHTERFFKLLESAMPDWMQIKQRLNNSTLSYWRWDC